MNLREYWSLPPSGQGSQQEIINAATPICDIPNCVMHKPAPVNPCLSLYGTGQEGQTCKGCVHLRYSSYGRNRYWKCDLRTLTHGSATDHRVGWPACGRYEKRTEEYHGG